MVPQPHQEPGVAHILIAEDDALVRAGVAEELRAAGFSVIEANCADDALTYVREGGKIDLVFSDIQMPGTLDGRQLAEVIARDHPGIPVILTSGETLPDVSALATLFVAKTYSVAHAITLFCLLLGLQPPESHS
ncbi:response regulator [Paraburkholderia sp. J76]|uniref:response regulator n=1 Tax=Paraburkholderia sp. J76 TaxID=2805439 RepID=UPI002ABE098E|nr:response regulator [Paraburkholderia sp. J76]